MTPSEALMQIPMLATQPFLSINQLDGGYSNQSYLISTPDCKYVLRLDGEAQQIFNCCRIFELEILNLASNQKLSPKPVFSDLNNGVLLYTFLEGRRLTSEDLANNKVKQQFLQLTQAIAALGKKIKADYPKQQLLGDIKLDKNLPQYEQFLQSKESVKLVIQLLNRFVDENCLCHNDLSPSNLMLDENSQLFALDWEYAATNHPLLDFAFFANNYQLSSTWLDKHYSNLITHQAINFEDVRRLAWFIEAVWYAKRQAANPDKNWLELMNLALNKL